MQKIELWNHIINRGYKVKSIRLFKNSFHVNYWHPNWKARAFFKVPLSALEWKDLEDNFPQVER